MKAIIRETEFMGKAGVGVYINGGLSTFVIRAIDLLATMEALKDMGYNVLTDEIDYEDAALFNDWEDETEMEEEMGMWELEDAALLTDWEDEGEALMGDWERAGDALLEPCLNEI